MTIEKNTPVTPGGSSDDGKKRVDRPQPLFDQPQIQSAQASKTADDGNRDSAQAISKANPLERAFAKQDLRDNSVQITNGNFDVNVKLLADKDNGEVALKMRIPNEWTLLTEDTEDNPLMLDLRSVGLASYYRLANKDTVSLIPDTGRRIKITNDDGALKIKHPGGINTSKVAEPKTMETVWDDRASQALDPKLLAEVRKRKLAQGSKLITRIMQNRDLHTGVHKGQTDKDEAVRRLSYFLDLNLPKNHPSGIKAPKQADIYELPGAKEVIDSIVDNMLKEKNIWIHGDFDPDGVYSTVIMMKAFEFMKYPKDKINYFVPNRFKQGHIVTEKTLDMIKEKGGEFVITCDTGISAKDSVEHGKKIGLEFAVTDHHEIEEEKLPDCPRTSVAQYIGKDDNHPLRHLCGAGVAARIALAVMHKYVEEKCKKLNETKEPDKQITAEQIRAYKAKANKYFMEQMLPFQGLGTLADLMTYHGDNRLIFKNALEQLTGRENIFSPGFKMKADGGLKVKSLARLLERVTEREMLDGTTKSKDPKYVDTRVLAMKINPAVNATSRVSDTTKVVKMFLSDNDEEIDEIITEMIGDRDQIKGHVQESRDLTQTLRDAFGTDQELMERAQRDKVLFMRNPRDTEELRREEVGGINGVVAIKVMFDKLVPVFSGGQLFEGSRKIGYSYRTPYELIKTIPSYTSFLRDEVEPVIRKRIAEATGDEEYAKSRDAFKFGGHRFAGGINCDMKTHDIVVNTIIEMTREKLKDYTPYMLKKPDAAVSLHEVCPPNIEDGVFSLQNFIAPWGKDYDPPTYLTLPLKVAPVGEYKNRNTVSKADIESLDDRLSFYVHRKENEKWLMYEVDLLEEKDARRTFLKKSLNTSEIRDIDSEDTTLVRASFEGEAQFMRFVDDYNKEALKTKDPKFVFVVEEGFTNSRGGYHNPKIVDWKLPSEVEPKLYKRFLREEENHA